MPATNKVAKPDTGKKRTARPAGIYSKRVLARNARTGAIVNPSKTKPKRVEAKMFAQIVGEPLAGFAAVKSIRKGYSARILKSASSFFDVPDARILHIAQVAPTTASRLEKNDANIDAATTERVFRMGTVTRMAIDVFEDESNAIEWMRQPNLALGGTAPLDLLDTEVGGDCVRQVLNAIETGVVV
jgi:putative toxin-antitoxin system antitoxin component (TIGR02293 family)